MALLEFVFIEQPNNPNGGVDISGVKMSDKGYHVEVLVIEVKSYSRRMMRSGYRIDLGRRKSVNELDLEYKRSCLGCIFSEFSEDIIKEVL